MAVLREAALGEDGTEQLWAVVCTHLHTSFGPFSTQEKANMFAERLSAYTSEMEKEEGRPSCTYVAIPMWVQMAVVEKPPILPERLN